MAVSLGRLREDTQYDYKFVGLSHNTLRGAAGGAVLLAELLCAKWLYSAGVKVNNLIAQKRMPKQASAFLC